MNRLDFKDEIKNTEFFILCLKRISLFALNLLYSSAKPQESPETPSKSPDKPASSVKRCGVNLLGMLIEEKSAELRLSQNKLTELCLQRYLPEMRMWN